MVGDTLPYRDSLQVSEVDALDQELVHLREAGHREEGGGGVKAPGRN